MHAKKIGGKTWRLKATDLLRKDIREEYLFKEYYTFY